MRRITRNVLLTAGAVGVLLAVPIPAHAGPCNVCDAAADAADGLLGGILPDPLAKLERIPGQVIRSGGDKACAPLPGAPRIVQQAHGRVCEL